MKSAFPLISVALFSAILTGCTSGEQLRRIEQEITDLKLLVNSMKLSQSEAIQRQDAEQKAASEARTIDRRFQADLDQRMTQVQEHIRAINSRMGTSRVTASSGSSPSPSSGTSLGADDERAFNSAVLDYNKGNYPLARDSFDLFLKSHPTSSRKPDALFFMGLCHYNQKAFDRAQAVFEQIIRDHPSSNQALPARLKRAQCLQKQGLTLAATKAYRELVEQYPSTPESRTAQQELSDLGL